MKGEKLAADTVAGFGVEATGGFDPGQGLINTVAIFLLRIGYEIWTERRRRKREQKEKGNAFGIKSPPEA